MTSEPEVEFFRCYELRLLHCTLPPSIPPPSNEFHSSHPLHLPLDHLLTLIEAGNYSQALFSDAAKLVLKLTDESSDSLPNSFTNSVECADQVYSELLNRVGFIILDEAEDGRDRAYRVMMVTCVAVAAFLGFTQCNITGFVGFSVLTAILLVFSFPFLFSLSYVFEFGKMLDRWSNSLSVLWRLWNRKMKNLWSGTIGPGISSCLLVLSCWGSSLVFRYSLSCKKGSEIAQIHLEL